MTDERKEAAEALVEALDEYDKATTLLSKNAAGALAGLQERWRDLCLGDVKDVLPVMHEECEDILSDCAVLRDLICERATLFTDDGQRLIDAGRDMGADSPALANVAEEIGETWNNGILPEIRRLHAHVGKLEDSIHETMAKIGQGAPA